MIQGQTLTKTGWNLDNSYARLPQSFFSLLTPMPVPSPQLAIFNSSVAAFLGLDIEELQSTAGVSVLAGNQIPEGAVPLAQAYAGHQFGHFTMLGDGRALLLGEQITPQGERLDIQLKGSGRTPYSRRGDGRAALGPMLREYIISEAMYALGVPTTRSLAVVTSGEPIIRETYQPGAILTRVAASHLRVGTFQYAANWCSIEELRVLADYTLSRHFPNLESDENQYLYMLREVVRRQAELIAKWQLIGFVHGVMNTDNMTISGETIDYGPCAFMDAYNPATVFSSIDVHGRYAYGNQPYIAAWNLARLAEALLPLLHDNQSEAVKIAEDAISDFTRIYQENWLSGMREKLGLFNEEQEDQSLVEGLLDIMQNFNADYTNTFRALSIDKPEASTVYGSEEFDQWYTRWQARLDRQEESRVSSQNLMKRHNPSIIPRNHRVEEALEAAVNRGDYNVMNRLLAVLSNPYSYSPQQDEYAKLPEPSPNPYKTFCGT